MCGQRVIRQHVGEAGRSNSSGFVEARAGSMALSSVVEHFDGQWMEVTERI
jgi:hypothetical protein